MMKSTCNISPFNILEIKDNPMPAKEREILLRLNQAVKSYDQPVPTTFAPSTGQYPPPNPIQPNVNPLPILTTSQSQG